MSKHAEPRLIGSLWDEIRSALEDAKQRIYQEIRIYPAPITACDEQFDALLARRDRISRELDRMRDISKASLAHDDPGKLIEEFVTSSDFIAEEIAQGIRSTLKRASSEPAR